MRSFDGNFIDTNTFSKGNLTITAELCDHESRPAPPDSIKAVAVGASGQRHVPWFALDQRRPAALPDPLETCNTPHARVRRGEHHLQGKLMQAESGQQGR